MLREYGLDNKYVTTDDDTVYQLLSKRALERPDELIAQFKDPQTNQWVDVMAGEMLAQVRSVAKGLMAIGARPGTMVAIYSATSYEWGVMDFACASIGAVSVPIYETDSQKQADSIITEVQPAIAFGGDENHTHTLERIAEQVKCLRHVFNFENGALEALIDYGESVSEDELDAAIGRVRADDLLTIVFTSGSTGKPKGAMLSHRNFTHIVKNGYEILPEMLYDAPNRLLLFLPLAHCFARYIQYVAIGGYGVVGYVPDAKHLLADLCLQADVLARCAPRIREGLQRSFPEGRRRHSRAYLRQCRRPFRLLVEDDVGTQTPGTDDANQAFVLYEHRGLVLPIGPWPEPAVSRVWRSADQSGPRAFLQWHR